MTMTPEEISEKADALVAEHGLEKVTRMMLEGTDFVNLEGLAVALHGLNIRVKAMEEAFVAIMPVMEKLVKAVEGTQ